VDECKPLLRGADVMGGAGWSDADLTLTLVGRGRLLASKSELKPRLVSEIDSRVS